MGEPGGLLGDEGVQVALRALDPARYDDAVALAELPDLVRGYEDLKLRRIAELRERLSEAVARASR